MPWILLSIAIVAEIIATTLLKMSNGFSKLTPTAFSILGYVVAFYFLSLTLKNIPVGVAYAVWSGVGIVAIAIIGYLFFQQTLNFASIAGIALIILGVVILNLFPNTNI